MDYINDSNVLKALAHPVRLRITEMLMSDECCVNELKDALDLSQSTCSQHLGILRNAGVLTPKKFGTRTCYNVDSELAKTIIRKIKEKEG